MNWALTLVAWTLLLLAVVIIGACSVGEYRDREPSDREELEGLERIWRRR